MDESLDKNLLFNTLVTKYSKLYDAASEECCLIVVPRNKYLKYANINESFIIHHILKPSMLLKSHFTPYKKCSIADVQVESDHLVVQRDGEKESDKIRIVGEEIAYNEKNKSYKILLVEKPLIRLKINPSALKEENTAPAAYFTFEECESYLCSLSARTVKEVKEKVAKFLASYLILPDYLADAASKLRNLVDYAIQSFSSAAAGRFDEEVLVTSVECYVLALAYDSVYPVIQSHLAKKEKELADKLRKMEADEVHFVDIGCNKMFRNYRPSEQIYEYLGSSISTKKSPLEKVYVYKRILDRINDELNDFLNLTIHSPFSKCKYEVLTDDLMAIVVYVLIKFNSSARVNSSGEKAGHSSLLSELEFIQTFSYYLHISSSAYGYALTTFEVAIGYIKDYHFEFASASPTKSLTNGLNKLNGSIKSRRKNSDKGSFTSNDSTSSDTPNKKPEVRRQLNFTSAKLNENLDNIAKLIEETSFSFQQLENAEKND